MGNFLLFPASLPPASSFRRFPGADTVLAGDMGCLMNIAGTLTRRGSAIPARHVAEVLAGMTDTPAIGEPEG